MTPARPRAATACVAGALALATLASGAPAATAAEPAHLTAALQMSGATAWYGGGQFVVHNDGGTPAPWQLEFEVPAGTFSNWAGWATDTVVDGTHVTVTSEQPLAAGATANVSFGVQGDGSAVATVEACSLDGAPVADCSPADEPGEPEEPGGPEGPEEPEEPEEPEDTTAPSAVGDLRATTVGRDRVVLAWTAASDDRGVESYELRRVGADPVDVPGTTATVEGLTPSSAYAFEVVARDASGNTGPATPLTVTTAAVVTGRLDVRADSSTAPVLARGDAEEARVAEGRKRRQSDFDPTGRFARKGDVLTLDVPAGVTGLQAVVALYGQYAGYNDGEKAGTERFDLSPGHNEVVAPFDGFVYLRDPSTPRSRATTVEVGGGDAVATFVEGESDEATFERQLDEFDASFGMLVGDNVMVEVQKWALRDYLVDKGIDAGPRIRMMERFVQKADDLFGLDRDATGTAGRAPQRVLVTNPDDGAGSANAAHERIEMHNGHGAMRKLLSNGPTDVRLFWHELGHTYQPDWMNWSGMGESSVEVVATAIQEDVNGGRPVNRLDTFAAEYEAWFRTPVEQRDFATAPESAQRLMFDQLRRAYGEEFYARMAEDFRVDRLFGEPVPPASDTAARQQEFALVASEVAGQDLTDFFHQWGIDLTEATRAELGRRPAPSSALHENRWRPTDRVEHVVTMTDGALVLAARGSVTWGQRVADDGVVDVSAPPTGHGAGRRAVTTPGVGAGQGRVLVEIVAADGSAHAAAAPVDVRRGSMAALHGASGAQLAGVALDASTGQLSVRGVTFQKAASSFGDQHYVSARLVAADGSVVASSSIRGTEYPYRFVRELDGTAYEDGQYVVLGHLQAASRLRVWSDDTSVPASGATEQAFRIDGGTLVPVPLSEVPAR